MTPWLTLVIGVILGLLLGWLIDLLWRRRSEATRSADAVAAPTRTVEWSLPRPAPVAVVPAGLEAEESHDLEVPATTDMEDALAEDVLAPAESKAPDPELSGVLVDGAAPVEAERVDWPDLTDRVAEAADEVTDAPAHIRAELPPTTERLSSDDLAALAPEKDDLLRIEGIGRVYDSRLRAAGINTFAELVNVGEARLQDIIQPQTWQRVNFAEWIEQARLIHEGNEEELRLLQERLFRRKKG